MTKRASLALFVVGFCACGDEGASAAPAQNAPAASRDSIVVLLQARESGIRSARRELIRDSSTFAHAWTEASGDVARRPSVDFRIDEVIFVALGQRPSTGHAVRVLRVRSGAKQDSVDIEITVPGKNCGTSPVVQTPATMVRHRQPRNANERSASAVVFIETTVATPC